MSKVFNLPVTVCVLYLLVHIIYFCGGYFIKPRLQICDANRLRKFAKQFCKSKLVFSSNSTRIKSDCICMSGIWLTINRNCVPTVIVSNQGCLLSSQIKAIQYLGSFGSNDFFGIVSKSDYDLQYSLLRPVQSKESSGHVWLYNGGMKKSEEGQYCAERRLADSPRNFLTNYEIHGRIILHEECPSIYNFPVQPMLEYGELKRNTSECKIDCSQNFSSKLKQKDSSNVSATFSFLRKSPKSKTTNNILTRGKIVARKTTGIQLPEKLNSLYLLLQKRLLLRILSLNFPTKEVEPHEDYIPKESFQILEKLQKIVYKTCSQRVSQRFLELAHHLFRVIYERRGTHLIETLKEEESSRILIMLDGCYNSLQPLQFIIGNMPCPKEEINFVTKEGLPIRSPIKNEGNVTRHHQVVEIVWNMVDLTVGVCIGAFAKSYVLYHKMEQALEKLFTNDLKFLWKLPPNETFHTRLFGPKWKYFTENLEKCVEAVYMHNPKLTRLRRPEEIVHRQFSKSHKRIKIPDITSMAYRPKENKTTKLKTIIKSVNLTCQPFGLSKCFEDNGLVP